MFLELQHITLVQHDVKRFEIVSQAPHLHVVALANDDGMIAVANQRSDGLVRHVDERACRFNALQAQRANLGERSRRCPVSRHHHSVRRHFERRASHGNSPGLQAGQDSFVVNQIAEDSERRGFAVRQRQRDRVADAEAHPEMFCPENSHSGPCTKNFTT
jgi:hypothetical protein